MFKEGNGDNIVRIMATRTMSVLRILHGVSLCVWLPGLLLGFVTGKSEKVIFSYDSETIYIYNAVLCLGTVWNSNI